MHLHLSISAHPVHQNATWAERWSGRDQGLIACWERGRGKALEDPELALAAKAGRLVVLPWKGGVEKTIKAGKFGTLSYLAMWQGLRGDDLNIDTESEYSLTCTSTGVTVVYTGDASKYSIPEVAREG